jgi:alpha-glucosidase (family GH31 glycosyl hydrolase)
MGTISLPVLADWETWGVATTPFAAPSASFGLTITCTAQSLCPVNVDSIAITATGAPFPTAPAINALGGWRRGLDGFSGSVPLYPGMLSTNGWYLLDDGQTPLWDGTNLPTARPHADVDHQDGYAFGYGNDYAQALKDFVTVAGPPPMLPRYAFGVAFSEYFAYHDTDLENTVVPAFRAHTTALDTIGVDTDWKSPVQWDGWEWNPMTGASAGGWMSPR